MSIIIREAVYEDIPQIHAIVQEAFAKYAHDLGDAGKVVALQETQEDIKREIDEKTVLVGIAEGEIVGTIRYEVLDFGVTYISRFGIKLMAQGCGLGRQIIEYVVERTKLLGLPAVTLHTSSKMASLIRFYYARGFYIHSTSVDKGYIRALLVRETGDISSVCFEDIKK